MNIDELRQHYLNKGPYPVDQLILGHQFTEDEISGLRKYGYWFEAIWAGKVPLSTEKLHRFKNAMKLNPADRNKWEDLWVRYDMERCPF
ncbi:hypothetical protein N8000_05350 [Rhodospirillales bacterium]|nr:hypothetical protein [Rhodospirillales bacterium]